MEQAKPRDISIKAAQRGGQYRDVCEYAEFLAEAHSEGRAGSVSIAFAVAEKLRGTDGYRRWAKANKRKVKA